MTAFIRSMKILKLPSLKKRMGEQPTPAQKPKRFTHSLFVVDQVLASLAINILSLGLPIMTLQIYDRILTSPGTGTLSLLIAGVAAIVVVEMLLRIARAYLNGWAGATYEHMMSCQAVRHAVEADPIFSLKRHAGEYLGDLGAISRQRDFHSGQASSTLMDIPFIVIFLGMIAYLAGWLVLVPVALLLAFTMVAWAIGVSLKDALAHRDASDERRYSLLIETLEGIHNVKMQGFEKPFLRRYESLQAEANPLNYQVGQASCMAYTVGSVFSQLMVVAVVAAGAPFVMNGLFSTGTLIACVLLSGRIMQPVQRGLALWTRYQDYQLARARTQELFTIPQLACDPQNQHAERAGLLECKQLNFAFPDSKEPVCQDVSITVKRGECIAIVGDHSVGKTTLLRLMAGLYAPTGGQVLVDGYEASRYQSSDLLKHIAYVSSDAVVFRGTIMENLTSFRDEKYTAAHEMAAMLGIDKAVNKLPMGYDTVLEGATGDAVAPGLKQRIAIARVLIEKPRIILFDQADRALDKTGYNYVFRLLGRLRSKTAMVIVSDDRNLLSLADRTLKLEHGKLQKGGRDMTISSPVLRYAQGGQG